MGPKPMLAACCRQLNRSWADLPLRIKGLVVVAIPLAALVASTGSWYLIQRDDREADTWVERTTEVANTIRACLARPLNDGPPERDWGRLELLLRGQPVRLGDLRRVRESYRRHGTEALRAGLRAMLAREEEELVARIGRVAQVRRRALAAVVATAVLGLVGGLLAIVLFTSGIVRRVEWLQWNAALLEQPLPIATRALARDELGSLERAFETAAANLRHTEEERDRFFTLSLDMLCIVTLEGRFKRVNPAFTNVLGHPEETLVAGNILDFVHPGDRERSALELRQLAGGRPVTSLEIRVLCNDGSYRWLAWSIAPFLAEGLAYAVVHDRTRQKLDEEALRASGARLSSVLESITEGFFAIDREYRLIYINREAERLWTQGRRNLTGLLLWEVLPEDDDGPFHCLYQRALVSSEPAHAEQYYRPFDRWFELHVYPSAEGLSVYFRDITERHKAEEQIRRALKEKEILLREIHHRVKNNLQVICSLLRLQERYMPDENVRRVLKDSRERVHAMAILHDQLHRAKDLSSIDLGDYFRNLAASLFCSYGVNSAQIGLALDLEHIPASIDIGIPCGLIVHELVSNAVQHAFPEGRKGCVSIALHGREDETVDLTVSDDGTGIPPDAGSPEKASLGLRLVDLLAEQIGAAVERSAGAGTQYRLIFEQRVRKGESNK